MRSLSLQSRWLRHLLEEYYLGEERWLFAVVIVDDLLMNVTGPTVSVTAITTHESLLECHVLLL